MLKGQDLGLAPKRIVLAEIAVVIVAGVVKLVAEVVVLVQIRVRVL